MKIARESCILAAIGLADLVTTILFIQQCGAQEANPVFGYFWEMGLLAFILAKLFCMVGPLAILEWARRSRPVFVVRALRFAILCYLGAYSIGVLTLNSSQAKAREVALIAQR